MLPGAEEGILFYLTPDWNRLTTAKVWGDAAVQIFFALSPAWGGLITLSSYNKFSNNCYKDSLIVAVSNIATSFFAGLVIFSIIGFLAHESEKPVAKVVDQGAGLAFIVYPEVVSRLPVAPVWSLLFFFMLLTLGLDSQFALMETVTTAILDKFPSLRNYKVWVVLGTSIVGYFGGLIFTTSVSLLLEYPRIYNLCNSIKVMYTINCLQSGMYWLQLMDKYAANWSVLLIAISECILVAWIYGANRFLDDIQLMIGPRGKVWRFFWGWMWKVVTPAALFFILFFNWVEYEPLSYGTYVYPTWANEIGWIIGMLPVSVIIGVAINQLCKHKRLNDNDDEPENNNRESCWCLFKRLLQPTSDWGPAVCNSVTPSRTLINTPSPSGYDSTRTNPNLLASGQRSPGPSILKNSSKKDLISSEQV